MSLARVNGIQLYCERWGRGRPFFFIGATGGDLRQKPNVLEGPWVESFEVDCWDHLADVACPVLICSGRNGGLALSEAQKSLYERISGSKRERFKGGHLFGVQAPKALPAIEAFLEGL